MKYFGLKLAVISKINNKSNLKKPFYDYGRSTDVSWKRFVIESTFSGP